MNEQPPLLDTVRRWSTETPDATAVQAADGSLTFAELHEATLGFCGALAEAGAAPGVVVALGLERSRLALPGLLATWWLGATAVPISVRDPADRTGFILGDSRATILLAHRPPNGAMPRAVRLVPPPVGSDTGHGPPVTTVHDRSCAYVIYTSGTTGWPKGVDVSYGALATFLTALGRLGMPTGGNGVNAVSPTFDGWLWCALLYLLHGQSMALLDAAGGGRDGASDLAGQIREVAPRVVCLTPSLLQNCVDAVDTAEMLVVAGEPLPAALADRLAPGRRMLNVYGPTETTIAATWADSAAGDDVMTIGRPLPGYTVYVLDPAGLPVGDGEVGELYVTGPAVATGYRGRPALTAARFVPDPWIGGGQRMYRTGDLVRRRPDGQLVYHGRTDDQIKLRGFRIEPLEVEQVAAAATDIRGAAAFVRGDVLGLAVVPAPRADVPAVLTLVRDHCAAKLPEHMTPAQVIAVESIPTTNTGKVDRAALAAMADACQPTHGRGPATDTERLVCLVWGELLERPFTDVEANFYEVGGHSLLAARSIAELRARTGLAISVRHLLAAPTAAELACTLDEMEPAR
ncbi:non-ribosomal peptide synthetase [Actinoplanes sp. NPDC051346]|uniref:non-ribosomal peptide synthetase n=1 Tax=Actinoplanes sp. NPDC051346 TaxID=3155048 RepID=UPI003440D11A